MDVVCDVFNRQVLHGGGQICEELLMPGCELMDVELIKYNDLKMLTPES